MIETFDRNVNVAANIYFNCLYIDSRDWSLISSHRVASRCIHWITIEWGEKKRNNQVVYVFMFGVNISFTINLISIFSMISSIHSKQLKMQKLC